MYQNWDTPTPQVLRLLETTMTMMTQKTPPQLQLPPLQLQLLQEEEHEEPEPQGNPQESQQDAEKDVEEDQQEREGKFVSNIWSLFQLIGLRRTTLILLPLKEEEGKVLILVILFLIFL